MSSTRTTKGWTVEGNGSFDALKFQKDRILPELTANDVLVKFHAASVNYRDVIIALVIYPSRTSELCTKPHRVTTLSRWHRTLSQALTELGKS